MAGLLGFDPGPWKYWQLKRALDGLKERHARLSLAVWEPLVAEPEPTQRRPAKLTGADAAKVLDKFFPIKKV